MNEKKKSLSQSGVYYLVYQVLNLAFPLITGIYVTRILLPENIGQVAAAQNIAQYFVIFSFLGIPTYGLREIAKVRNNPEEKETVFSELFIINFISTFFFLFVYCLLIFMVDTYRKELNLYLIVGISIALNIFNISWLYEGLEEFRFISLRNIIFKIISFGLLLLFVRTEKDYITYAIITILGTAGNYIVNMVYSPRFVKLRLHGLNIKRHLKPVFYFVAVNLAIEIYSLMDITMMNFFCEKESITFYKYGHSIEMMLLQIVNTFTIVLIPRISFYYKEKQLEEYNRLLSKTLIILFIVSIPMITGILFVSDFLIPALYGQAYIRSVTILKMFSSLLLISPIGYLLGSRVMLVTNHENMMIRAVGIGALANLVGNLVLIPGLAEYGATIASIISEFIVMIVYVNMGRKYFKLKNIKSSVVKIIISACVMSLFLWMISIFHLDGWAVLVIQVFCGALIYFGMMILLKEEVVSGYFQLLIEKIKMRV